MVDEQKLRQLAEAATPGPWSFIRHTCGLNGEHDARDDWTVYGADLEAVCMEGSAPALKDPDFIAAANPAVILHLLDELQTLREERTAWRVTAENAEAACEQPTKKELPMLSISDKQAEAIASEVYARNPVDGVDAAFKLDWELVRAGVSHAKALSTDDSCQHGNAHIVHDCLRCGAPVCCGKCCADDAANEPDVAGKIAYQLTKKLVIDMPTARAAVDAAIDAAMKDES
jgi:hypothetical protein